MMLCMMHYVQKSQHKNAEKKLKKKQKKNNQRAEKHPNKVKIVSRSKKLYTKKNLAVFGQSFEWE